MMRAHVPPPKHGSDAGPVFERGRASGLRLGALPGAVSCGRLHLRQVRWEWHLTGVTEDAELMYLRVVVFLREGILTGKYPDGKVPATAFLARRFHTSSSTVGNAYAELEKDGLIARGPYRPPLIVARAQPYRSDGRFIEAVTGDGRALFCQQCWARVPLGPREHVCQ